MLRKRTALFSFLASALVLASTFAGGAEASSAKEAAEASAKAPEESAKGAKDAANDANDAKTPSGGKGVDASMDIMQRLVSEWDSDEMDEADGVPMEDLSFPVDHFDDGTVKAQFFAKWALMPNDPNAFVRAKGVVIELYDEQGRMNGYYKAENCIYDRTTQTGYSEGKVRMEYHAPDRNIRIDGFDMQWNLATRNAKILRQPVVTMSEIMEKLGGSFRK